MPRFLRMLALVIAGELVFGLAFNVPRFFRPTLLDVFGFSNTQLGDMFAVYGVAAMLAYFPGGAMADRFSARALITLSLLSTALGGLFMATIPGESAMMLLYGYWGITTIFLFWGALIRATREWGGEKSQGVAFGILDGGRGLVAASVALLAVNVLAFYLPENARLASVEEREQGLQMIVLLYTLFTLLSGIFVWFAMPSDKPVTDTGFRPLRGMRIVLRRPVIWAQAGIILCAYCCFRGLDNYSLYAVQVLGMDEVEGARLASYGAWTRPVAAVLAGLLADRFSAVRSIAVMFLLLCASYASWASATGMAIIYANFFTTYVAVHALRGIYFALLEENRTPKFLTGAAVGLMSLIGFAPDIFFGPISGRILDANPGPVGYQNYFLFLAGIAVAGLVMVSWLVWLRRQGHGKLWRQAE